MSNAADLNKNHFNTQAAVYDTKHGATIAKIIDELRARADFIGLSPQQQQQQQDHDDAATTPSSLRLLDYACGTGLVSNAFAPYVTQCVGVDVSENMVAAYTAKMEREGWSDRMRAVQGNLLAEGDDDSPREDLKGEEMFNFDVAAVGLGFHHFDDPFLAAQRLAARLRRGGILVIIDFLPHEKMDPSHGATATVQHNGFSEERIKEVFEQAGVGQGFAMQTIDGLVFPMGERKVFLG